MSDRAFKAWLFGLIFCGALVALLTSPAHAGTNTWTPSSGFGATCAPQTSFNAFKTCAISHANTTNAGCAPFSAGATSKLDNTPPSLLWSATLNGTPGGCAGFTAAAAFTVACPSGQEWNETYAGCVEICIAPDTLNTTTGMCDAPPDCDMFDGVVADRFFTGSALGGAVCAAPPGEEVMECEALAAEPTGFRYCVEGAECYEKLEFTGAQCGGEPDITGEDLTETSASSCISGGGLTVCATATSKNCGTFNGQSVCLDSVPEGRCIFLSNGGMACGSAAGSPPGPTEEDGVTPAEPDGEVVAAGDDVEERTIRYYGPGTVASSGSPTTGTSPDAPTDDEEPAGECSEEGDCELALPDVEGIWSLDSFGEVTDTFFANAMATPLLSTLAGIGADFPTAACPTASFELWGVTYTVDPMCDHWPDWAAVLSGIMIFAWAFVGFRILFSA